MLKDNKLNYIHRDLYYWDTYEVPGFSIEENVICSEDRIFLSYTCEDIKVAMTSSMSATSKYYHAQYRVRLPFHS